MKCPKSAASRIKGVMPAQHSHSLPLHLWLVQPSSLVAQNDTSPLLLLVCPIHPTELWKENELQHQIWAQMPAMPPSSCGPLGRSKDLLL